MRTPTTSSAPAAGDNRRSTSAGRKASPQGGQKRARPNVLFLIADQHNAKCLGCAGIVPVRTPNLDRLAREGVRFTSAVTNNPICTPSRTCYFSGQYVHNHGYYGLSGPNPGALPTLLGQFRQPGTRLPPSARSIRLCVGSNQTPTSFARSTPTSAADLHSPYDDYLRPLGLEKLRDDIVQMPDGRPSHLPYKHSVEAWCVREAMKFIDSCGQQPWIMQVSLPRPHMAYIPAKEFWDLYSDDTIWLPPNADADLSMKAPHLQKMRGVV